MEYEHSRIQFGLKNKENSVIRNNMNEHGGYYLEKISQEQEDKHFMISLRCGI